MFSIKKNNQLYKKHKFYKTQKMFEQQQLFDMDKFEKKFSGLTENVFVWCFYTIEYNIHLTVGHKNVCIMHNIPCKRTLQFF